MQTYVVKVTRKFSEMVTEGNFISKNEKGE
jgi:hypothetical protein